MWPSLVENSDHIRVCSGIELVAKVGGAFHPWKQTVADARLVAAAPELLDVLRELVTLKDEKPHDYEHRKDAAWQAARDIIAKAAGEVV
jgi:hypothetical protein